MLGCSDNQLLISFSFPKTSKPDLVFSLPNHLHLMSPPVNHLLECDFSIKSKKNDIVFNTYLLCKRVTKPTLWTVKLFQVRRNVIKSLSMAVNILNSHHNMHYHSKYLKASLFLTILLVSFGAAIAQSDTVDVFEPFDSELLRLKVPVAFQKSSLKLEVFADSSWQLFRGQEALTFTQSMIILGLSDKLDAYEEHHQKELEYLKEYRSRRVFSMATTIGGLGYLAIIWSKGWVYQIPGYAAMVIAGVRMYESHQMENQALREQYYIQTLIQPSEINKLVEDYNFKLYQYLSNAGIQFRET